MTCMYCGAPMPKRGLVCDYCGQRNPLNLNALEKISFGESRSAVTLSCPDCHSDMEHIDIGLGEEMVVHRCQQCDGIFITESDLADALRHHIGTVHKVDYSTLRFILDNPRQEGNDRALRQCPVCSKQMNKGIYAAVSGVLIDKCPEHGIWLDSGELKQLLEWRSVHLSLKRQEIKEKQPNPNPPQTPWKFTPETTRDPAELFFLWLLGGS